MSLASRALMMVGVVTQPVIIAVPPVVSTGSYPADIVISFDGLFAYVANAASVSQYSRSTVTGVLTALSPATIATGAGTAWMALSPNGASAYVSNNTDGTISQYSRNVTTGLLTALAPATVVAGTRPNEIVVSPEGTHVYVTDLLGNYISQYSRNTTTGALTALAPATVATGVQPMGVAISPNGASVYAANETSNTVSQFSRNTTTGLLTALSPASIAAGTTPYDVIVSPEGTHVYVTNYAGLSISQYSRNTSTGALTALSPATVATGTSSPYRLAISPDGTFIGATAGDALFLYSRSVTTGLLTARNPSSIATESTPQGVVISSDGAYVYVANTLSNSISKYLIAIANGSWDLAGGSYSGKSASFSGGITYDRGPRGLAFSSDGLKMYICGEQTDYVYQYTLATAWDVSTAAYAARYYYGVTLGKSRGIAFSSAGTTMYLVGQSIGMVYAFTLATAWNVTTATDSGLSFVPEEENRPNGIAFSADGTKLYVAGIDGNTVFQYGIATPWNISTATYSGKTLSVVAQVVTPRDLFFSTSGDKLFVLAPGAIYQYTLSTPWDVSTGSYANKSLSTAGEEVASEGLSFSSDGTKAYVIGRNLRTVFQYKLV